MVIIIPRTKETQACASCIVEGMIKGTLIMMVLSSPFQFGAGLGEAIFGTGDFLSGLAIAGSGLLFMILGILYVISKEKKARKLGERFLTPTKLGIFAIIGLIELIVGLALPYDGSMAAIRFGALLGGGITLLPAAILFFIIIRQESPAKSSDRKTGAPLQPPKEPLPPAYTQPTTPTYIEPITSIPTETVSSEDVSAEDFYSSIKKKQEEN